MSYITRQSKYVILLHYSLIETRIGFWKVNYWAGLLKLYNHQLLFVVYEGNEQHMTQLNIYYNSNTVVTGHQNNPNILSMTLIDNHHDNIEH